MRLKGLGAFALLLVLGSKSVGVSHASVIYNSLGQTVSGEDNVASAANDPNFYGPLADSFTTGSGPDDYLFNEVTVKLRSDLAHIVPGGNIIITLMADAGGTTQPGAFIGVIGQLNDSQLTATFKDYTFNLDTSTPLRLHANTRYWVQIQKGAAGDTSAQWAYGTDNSGIGVANEFFANNTGSYANQDGPYMMAASTVVPEPSAIIMAGLGVLGLGAGRLARRRKATSV